jgi:hypothetical protein
MMLCSVPYETEINIELCQILPELSWCYRQYYLFFGFITVDVCMQENLHI